MYYRWNSVFLNKILRTLQYFTVFFFFFYFNISDENSML